MSVSTLKPFLVAVILPPVHAGCEEIQNPVLVLCKIRFQHSAKAEMKLQQSELGKSSGHPTKLQSFSRKIPFVLQQTAFPCKSRQRKNNIERKFGT